MGAGAIVRSLFFFIIRYFTQIYDRNTSPKYFSPEMNFSFPVGPSSSGYEGADLEDFQKMDFSRSINHEITLRYPNFFS
jgi:hypothetical protein